MKRKSILVLIAIVLIMMISIVGALPGSTATAALVAQSTATPAPEEEALQEPSETADSAAATITDEQIEQMATLAPPPQLSDREPGVHTVPCVPGTGPYLAGEVEGEDYYCSVFTVPQNWDEPDGRYIDLGFVVANARSETPAPNPLVSIEGGPGASAVFRDNTSRYEVIRADRDIIKLDIRGVGLSQRTGYEECLVVRQ